MKLGACIDKSGTFLFKAPENNSKTITKKHVHTNMLGWIFHNPSTLNYIFLLPIERFILQTDQNETFYNEDYNPLLEISKEDAKRFYESLSNQSPKVMQKVNNKPKND